MTTHGMIAAIVKCIQRIALAAFDRTIAFGLIAASLPENKQNIMSFITTLDIVATLSQQ